MIQNKFTKFEIAEYVCGWLMENLQEDGSPSYWHSLDDIEGALANARAMLRDEQDGIVAGQKIKAQQRILHDD
jgi:hypothetical protein